MKHSKLIFQGFFLLLFFGFSSIHAQKTYKVHAHNDYDHELPFWYSYDNGAASIEVDIYLKRDSLFVTHAEDEIQVGQTLEKLYLDRLKELAKSDKLRQVQLLVDIKSEAHATLDKLMGVLRKYPSLIRLDKVKFVISGNRPKPVDYEKYPAFIWFDHQNLEDLDTINLDKVALVSLRFSDFSRWNGYDRMKEKEYAALDEALKKVHAKGKPFRLWATPDTEIAWSQLARLGLDFINTDKPALAVQFLDKLGQ